MEHVDVVIVGAGLSGIAAGRYMQAKCPWASYSIFEARAAVGGTWDLFRYPGLRSDSDMFTLGYSFRPWTGEQSIADGKAILHYIKQTSTELGIDKHIRFNHRIIRAEWSTALARWQITVQDAVTGETLQATCGFLFSCSGYYRYDHGYLPDFAGIDRFEGVIVHPQKWPHDLDYTAKQVVVIGSGSTAVTLVPAMATAARHVTMLQRSPTYIVSLPAKDPLANVLRRILPGHVSGPTIRWYKALSTQASYQISRRRPELVKWLLRKLLVLQLPAGYDIDTHFTPRYNPWDQRLCVVPNGDLFKAIKAGTVSVVTEEIDSFTEQGLRLRSGQELDAEIVVTATGLELLFLGDIDLFVDGEPVDLPSRLTYKGMMLENVPNLAIAVGYTNASWTLKCELTCDYVTRLLNHMRSRRTRQCMPVNNDPSIGALPLLSLTSGYVQRAADQFPKQGSKFPWKVYQSYLRDYTTLKMRSLDDMVMVFSDPGQDNGPAGRPPSSDGPATVRSRKRRRVRS